LPNAEDCREQLTLIALPLRQLVRARIGLFRVNRGEPFGSEQRKASGQLQLDLSFVPSRTFWRCRQFCVQEAVG
jgi:hypothetical protein